MLKKKWRKNAQKALSRTSRRLMGALIQRFISVLEVSVEITPPINSHLSFINRELSSKNYLGRTLLIYEPPALTGRAPRVMQYRNARIIGKAPVGISRANSLIEETIWRTAERTKSALALLDIADQWALAACGQIRSVRDVSQGSFVLLASQWDSFGHWIPEHFLKVFELGEAGIDIGTLTFVVRLDSAGFKKELLMRAGVRDSQIVAWEGQEMVVENLLVPDYPEISLAGLQWMSGLYRPQKPVQAEANLYLSRQRLEREVDRERDGCNVGPR